MRKKRRRLAGEAAGSADAATPSVPGSEQAEAAGGSSSSQRPKKKRKQQQQRQEGEEMDLVGEGEAANELKVSEKYAKKYNERKDREELAKARRTLADEDIGSSSETEETEDENAELLTTKVDNKIFDTLNKIRSKDPVIYDGKHTFFDDKDFAEEKTAKSAEASEPKKGVRYKDFLRDTLLKEGADALVKEEEALEKKYKKGGKQLTPLQEQQELKANILAAAHGGGEDGDDSDGDFFTIKKKTNQEKEQEDEEFEAFTLRKDKEPRSADGDDIVARYWKADEDLDENERFLRDYLMNKGWLETTSLQAPSAKLDDEAEEDGSQEDRSDAEEEHLEEADQFEKDYNFRFEVEEGRQIQSHARFQQNSVRERPDKRRRQRQEKAERKEADKIRRTEELKRLKNLKKQEIVRRLQQLKEITGNEDIALGPVDLDEEFNPESHDQVVQKLLGENFDEQEEQLKEEELVRAPHGCEDELDVAEEGAKVLARRGVSGPASSSSSSAPASHRGSQSQEDEQDEPDVEDGPKEDEEADPQQWWLCDECHKGIPGGKKRFDCTVCENYTLCIKCFRVRRHPHKFVRCKVPTQCMPPEELKDQEADRPELDKVMDEYFQLDYEDIIGGDLPTRFKYRKVEPENYGISAHDMLYKSDKELNQIAPLKWLRPYRNEAGGEEDVGPRGRGRGRKGHHAHQNGAARQAKQADADGVSAQRLGAYNLGADRRFGRGGRGGRGR